MLECLDQLNQTSVVLDYDESGLEGFFSEGGKGESDGSSENAWWREHSA